MVVDKSANTLRGIGVVGAGNMGSGIAQAYAARGYSVQIVDQSDEILMRGKARMAATLEEAVGKRLISPDRMNSILENCTFSTDINTLGSAQLIIEAIFEDIEQKKALFRRLDGLCDANACFATNTSSFYVSDLASATTRPERVVGLHYFYHPAKNRLVEVIRGKETNDRTFQFAWDLQDKIGKVPVASTDSTGFIVNRFFVPWLNEAVRLLEEGISNTATIEACAKELFGISMGPFTLMNVTGIPITLHAATTLARELGAFYAPCDSLGRIVAEKGTWDITGPVDRTQFPYIQNRLLGVVFCVATRLVYDESVCSMEDCDLSARLGLRWEMGPFEHMALLGTEKSLEIAKSVSSDRPSLLLPQELARRAHARTPFEVRQISTQIDKQLGIITINRPDALNALNESIVAQLEAAFHALEKNEAITGILIEGRGKAFVAGADTRFFVDQLVAGNVGRIVEFASRAQALLRRIDASTKPVLCAMNGLALGGGLELALACDAIIASDDAAMGFPETGIGIFPGLGGTQRTPRRVGLALARWLVLTGEIISATTACALGLIDAVVPKNMLRIRALEMMKNLAPRMENTVPATSADGFSELAAAFQAPLAALRASDVQIRSEDIQKTLARLEKKAPVALAVADELMHLSMHHSLDDGLRKETGRLHHIFSTKDALTGLHAIGKSAPVFRGE